MLAVWVSFSVLNKERQNITQKVDKTMLGVTCRAIQVFDSGDVS